MARNPLYPEIATNGKLAVTFRGYNITNAGKTAALLDHPLLGQYLDHRLEQADALCSDVINRHTQIRQDLIDERPSDLDTYPADLAMIVAVELAHWDALQELLGEQRSNIKVLVGYSLGEVTAAIVSGLIDYEAAMRPVLELSRDAAALADRVTMGIVFSRGPGLDVELVRQKCEAITAEGKGVIAVSTYLAPNTVLLMGENETVDRFGSMMSEFLPKATHLRKNQHLWPPLHTPIVLQKQLRDRAAVTLQTTEVHPQQPAIPILSCVSGNLGYTGFNTRKMLTDWVDHPQQLWKCVHGILDMGIDHVIHLGPEPNIIPATLTRIADNVLAQINQPNWMGYGLRTFSKWAGYRRWLNNLLSHDAVLLRAPYVIQTVFEDRLLEPEEAVKVEA